MTEERQLSSGRDLLRMAQEFQKQLKYPERMGPRQQFAIFLAKYPGSGGTTVAKEFARLAGNCFHVQANDTRVVLAENGFGWGVNVKTLLQLVIEQLLAEGHSIILDGAFLEDKEITLRESLVRKFSLKHILVAVNCPLEVAAARARERYADGQPSRFGDWRAMTDGQPDVEKHIASMVARRDKLEVMLENDRDHTIKVVMNHVDNYAVGETQRQVREIWWEFKTN